MQVKHDYISDTFRWEGCGLGIGLKQVETSWHRSGNSRRVKVNDNGWTCTRPSAEELLKVPLGGGRHTRPYSQKGNRGVDKLLAEPDPPSKNGIRMGGPVPDC